MDKIFANIIILFYVKLFKIIIGLLFINLNYFILHYLCLFMAINNNYIGGYYRLNYHRLLMAIGEYFIRGY
jgi:hypothetical protein